MRGSDSWSTGLGEVTGGEPGKLVNSGVIVNRRMTHS
jgi:hypothetical protein